MSNAKHTPGPWELYKHRGYFGIRRVGADPHEADIIDRFMDAAVVETEANAKLIAAAPDLAEALKEFLEKFGPYEDWSGAVFEKARAALAKAGIKC